MKISPIPPIKGPHGYILKAEKDSPKITQGGAMTFILTPCIPLWLNCNQRSVWK